jgi:hypothetical protein
MRCDAMRCDEMSGRVVTGCARTFMPMRGVRSFSMMFMIDGTSEGWTDEASAAKACGAGAHSLQ